MNDGIDPSDTVSYPDYKEQQRKSRKCIECGKNHDTIIENMKTGERVEEMQKCKDCLLFPKLLAVYEIWKNI